MLKAIRKFRDDRKAATAIEYGLLIAILGVGVFGVAEPLAILLNDMWTTIGEAMPG